LSHLLRPATRVDDFTTEKKVILEEIAMYLDEPGHVLYERLMETHFGKHPLSQSILGTAGSIEALQRDAMAAYFAKRYGPGNMVLAVTGRMDFEQVIQYVEKYCGAWDPVDAPRTSPATSYHNKRIGLSDPKLNRMYTMAMTPGPSAQDDRRFAARVLSDVIGDSEGSRFYWALVETAVAEEADFSFYPHDGIGSFMLSLTTSPDKTSKAMDLALAELQRVKTDLNDAEVERAKNKIASSIVLGGEVPIGRMRSIGSNWVYTGKYRSLDEDMATLMAITPRSLQELMSEFPFDPMTIVSLGPAEVSVS
jgi:predicted Zn-dependent peptidase